MPKGKGYPGQTKTGFEREIQGPIPRNKGNDGTRGQSKTGHLAGDGGGGISRPSGKDPVNVDGLTGGVTEGSGGGRSKGQGESNPARVDEITDI